MPICQGGGEGVDFSSQSMHKVKEACLQSAKGLCSMQKGVGVGMQGDGYASKPGGDNTNHSHNNVMRD